MMFTETGRPTLKCLVICIVTALIITAVVYPVRNHVHEKVQAQQELSEFRQKIERHDEITKALLVAAASREQFRSSMTSREFALWAALVAEAQLDDGFYSKETWFNAVDTGRPIYVQFQDSRDGMQYTFVVGLKIHGQDRRPGSAFEPCLFFYAGGQNGHPTRYADGFHPSKSEIFENNEWKSENSGGMLAHYNTQTTEIVERHLGIVP